MDTGNRDLLDELGAVILLWIIAALIGIPLMTYAIALRLHAGDSQSVIITGITGLILALLTVGFILRSANDQKEVS